MTDYTDYDMAWADIPRVCPQCNGRGTISHVRYVPTPNGLLRTTATLTCPLCDGKGRLGRSEDSDTQEGR